MIRKILQILGVFLLVFLIAERFWFAPEPKVIVEYVTKEAEKVVTEEPIILIEEFVEPEMKVQKVSFDELPNWGNDDLSGDIQEAFADSCKKIVSEKKEFLSDSKAQISTKEYQRICADFFTSAENFKEFITKHFDPHLVYYGDSEFGKFTSYYESRLNASYKKSDKYKYPIYGLPRDLVEINLKDFGEDLPKKQLVGRVEGNRFIPYHSRTYIYEKGLDTADVILWADDYVDIFVMQIQGSAIAHLDTGEDVRVSYANNNGHTFLGIGGLLLKKGLLQPGQSSMGGIKKWLKDDNNNIAALENMLENKRYIFHYLSGREGPIGAQGVPVRAGRSLAVDTKFIPLGSLLWLDTVGPYNEKIQKLVIAQDVGSAIKGAVRGDYFWGSGSDEILDHAGRMNSSGRYFIMLPKDEGIE